MNRRFFLRLLGIAPFIPLAAKLPALKPKPAEWQHFVGFKFIRTQLLPRSSDGFTKQLESVGKLAFTERIDVLPDMSHCTQVLHTHEAAKLQRLTWIDSEDDIAGMITKCRDQTRISLRKYWAQQARWKRKATLALYRA